MYLVLLCTHQQEGTIFPASKDRVVEHLSWKDITVTILINLEGYAGYMVKAMIMHSITPESLSPSLPNWREHLFKNFWSKSNAAHIFCIMPLRP